MLWNQASAVKSSEMQQMMLASLVKVGKVWLADQSPWQVLHDAL